MVGYICIELTVIRTGSLPSRRSLAEDEIIAISKRPSGGRKINGVDLVRMVVGYKYRGCPSGLRCWSKDHPSTRGVAERGLNILDTRHSVSEGRRDLHEHLRSR